MFATFHRSNFAEQIHELYHDLITFGTGVIFVEQDDEFDVRFSTRHIAECYLSEDDAGRVDTIYRKFKMPARAVVKRFGIDNVPAKIQKKEQENPYEMITLIHAVYERGERDIPNSHREQADRIGLYDPKQAISSESGLMSFHICRVSSKPVLKWLW